jgi:predicted RNase H-like HicB family nuclease
MSDGETQLEALTMIEDAKHGWLESALAHHDPIPEPEPLIA